MPKTIFSGDNRVVVEVIKDARLRAGLKQSELAAQMGRDQSWISLIENSQRRVDVVEFIELAKALKADPVELFGRIAGRIRS